MTIEQKFFRRVVLPGVFPITVIIATIIGIVLVGEALLALVSDATSELRRPELWVATFAAIAILATCAFLATRPAGSLGKLDEPVMIGNRPMLADPLPPVDVMARRGLAGTVDDIASGYILYARNGQIGVAREVLRDIPGEAMQFRKGLLYAQGLHGANDQMWIPIEAVSAVYPETRSAFLAIAGDEIEAYGWNNPPASFNLKRQHEEYKLY